MLNTITTVPRGCKEIFKTSWKIYKKVMAKFFIPVIVLTLLCVFLSPQILVSFGVHLNKIEASFLGVLSFYSRIGADLFA